MPRKTIRSHREIPDPNNPGEKIHVPARSPQFWIEGDIKSFRKCDDKLLDLYTEPFKGNRPLLRPVDLGIRLKLERYLWQGKAFSVREFAQNQGMRQEAYIAIIDRLENAMLLHRELCVDVQGQPVDLVLHTAFPVPVFIQQYDELFEHIETNFVDLDRKRAKAAGEQWPRVSLKLGERLKRLAQMEHEIKIKKICEVIRHVVEMNVGRTTPLTGKEFTEKVRTICMENKLPYNDKILREAFDAYEVTR